MKFLNYLLIFFLFIGCCKQNQPLKKTRILGHKGAGTHNKYNNTYYDNSIEAIVFALKNFDGAEVDIQMSKDSTLWLFHDGNIKNCKDSLINFCLLSDLEIYEYSKCNYFNSLAPLSNLFLILDTCHFQKKFLSLDLKGLINPLALSLYKQAFLFQHYGDLINSYAKEKNISLAVESKHVDFLKILSHSVETYLLELDDLHSATFIAKKNNFNGISCHFRKILNDTSLLDKIHDQNLKLQVWTPNKPKDIDRMIKLKIDYLQTDNLSYFIK